MAKAAQQSALAEKIRMMSARRRVFYGWLSTSIAPKRAFSQKKRAIKAAISPHSRVDLTKSKGHTYFLFFIFNGK